MKYTIKQYAHALYEALGDKKGSERHAVLQRFYAHIVKNRGHQHVSRIVQELESLYAEKQGFHIVHVESASPLPASFKKEIERVCGAKAAVRETVRPDLFAGIKITIDNQTVIDATAKNALRTFIS